MTEIEKVILKNQQVILKTLSQLLHTPGVASGGLHRAIQERCDHTAMMLKGEPR